MKNQENRTYKDVIGNLIPYILIFKIKFKKKMVRNNDVKMWRQRKVTEHLYPLAVFAQVN